MQTNTRKKYCFTPTRMAIIKKSDNKVSGMLRNRNSHTHPCEVPSHSEQDIGETTSQLWQKMEIVVTYNIRLQKTSWLLSCPPVNHSLWVKPTARSWGHSTSLREKPPWWDPANSQHSHAHHVQHGRRSVPPSQAFRWLQPWQTLSQNHQARPIPDPWPRDTVWDSKCSFFLKPAMFWGDLLCSNRLFPSPTKCKVTPSNGQMWAPALKYAHKLPPHTIVRFTIYRICPQQELTEQRLITGDCCFFHPSHI